MRAAYFHVGVLARLAEVGLLGQVRVISTVSGGTVVGALYYVLLRQKRPQTSVDYVEVVLRLSSRLREAGSHNLRARTFANPFKNLDMMIRPEYTRSDRIGDLLDRFFYRPSWGDPGRRLRGAIERQIELRQLADEDLPELVINSTCLNTGHNWRFTPTHMGEPPLDLCTERGQRLDRIDRNLRLDSTPLAQIGKSQRDFPLGLAVAASAAFPVLFSPLPISYLFPGIRVRLFDGGLHDNQGIEALLDESCSRFIQSDAAAQMDDQGQPSSILSSLLGRVIAIYGDRVREEQLAAYDWNANTLVHLREGLPRAVVHPYGQSGDQLLPTQVDAAPKEVPSIAPAAQFRLARMRTDLDAFSDREAHALMLDGYRIAARQLPEVSTDVRDRWPNGPPWPFDVAASMLRTPSARDLGILETGSKRFLKPLAQPPLDRIRWAAILLIVALSLLPFYHAALSDVLAQTGLWRGLLLLAPLAAVLPMTGWALTRALEYKLRKRLPTGAPATVTRWIARGGAITAGLGVAAALGLWDGFRDWARVGATWSFWWAAFAAATAIVFPALMGLVMSFLMWLASLAHLARGRF
jgi:predicted acylesterase/phospholipase RssA